MKKMRKLVVFLTVLSLAFSYSALLGTAQKAEAAVMEEVEDPALVEEPLQSGIICEEPEAEEAVVNDGNTVGVDASFFNTENQISGNWSGFTVEDETNCPITKYRYSVRKVTSPKETIVFWTEPANPTDTFFTKSGLILEEGAKYIIRVQAKNKGGWSDKISSNGQTLDTEAPEPITDLSIANRTVNDPNVVLNWSPSSDVTSGVEGYEVLRALSPFVKIGEADEDDTTFTDAGVIADNVNVGYKLKIWDEAGNSSESNIAYTLVDNVAPAAPVISYCRNGAVITINWPAVANASTYIVYRDGVVIPVGGALSYVDGAAKRGETHSYYVVAFDQAGNVSPASNTLVIYIPKPRISSISTAEVLGAATGAEQVQAAPSEVKTDEGQVEASEESKPEEDAEEAKTNWSLIIAIIIAAAIVIAGVLYWWYAREEEEDEI